MAFLDNSGDIILDAVLTKKGREALSSGTGLNITQFALGDDEINYGLYDKDHVSGSAYYDLEILQTPVLEAFTDINANINYGLLTFTSDELLYMPEIFRLTKSQLITDGNSKGAMNILDTEGEIYYIAANDETKKALVSSGEILNGKDNAITVAGKNERMIYLETGLDTTELAKTSTVQSTFTTGGDQALQESGFTVSVDSRIISGVNSAEAGQQLSNDDATGVLSSIVEVPGGTFSSLTGVSSKNQRYYVDYSIDASANNLYLPTSATVDQYTNIRGPGLSIAAFGIAIRSQLNKEVGGVRAQEYIDLGTVESELPVGSGTGVKYDYIDTIIYVTGKTSGVSLSVPVRIIRQSVSP